VILALATALRQHTLSIPIVLVQVPDPVAAGFVMSDGADLSGVPRGYVDRILKGHKAAD
jgi:ABC-type uncharacterized transport system substrate-binding protein